MGQYYKTVIIAEESDSEKKIVTIDNDCAFIGWIGLKLMEHSYLNNEWTDALAYLIYHHKVRVAHVGDYANEFPQYELAYNDHVSRTPLNIRNIWGKDLYNDEGLLNRFDYSNKYLINWDKKLYIDFDKYKRKSTTPWSDEVYVCPFTLLTALGNGRGGGDYYDEYPNAEIIGSWAWDSISIEDSKPEDFAEYAIWFTEKVNED